ncbi:MAG: response regulator transcription factor, partial [Bacteroidetes bacterium]
MDKMIQMNVFRMIAIKTLVVDDNESFRNILVEFLATMKDVEIVGQASSGREAIMKAQILKPDLILMDISMDEMDGFKAASLIKEKLEKVKIIFITIHKAETYRYIAALLQADGFVWKNSMQEELPMKLQRIKNSLLKSN